MAEKKAKVTAEWDEATEKKIEKKVEEWSKSCGKGKGNAGASAGGGVVWVLGFIGAAVYFIQTTDGFWDGLIGFLKALVWPGFLIYELMKFLGM